MGSLHFGNILKTFHLVIVLKNGLYTECHYITHYSKTIKKKKVTPSNGTKIDLYQVRRENSLWS